jgi:hypothetical protein
MRKSISQISTTALFALAAFSFVSARPAGAQTGTPTTFNYGLRLIQNGVVSNINDASTINFATEFVGGSATAQAVITFRGTTPTTVNSSISQIDLTGNTDFAIGGFPEVPFTLVPNQSFTINITFRPTTNRNVTAKITFGYGEGTRTGQFTLNLSGVAPDLVTSYILPNGNSTPYGSGESIVFPTTNIDETAVTTFVVTNRGTGPGVVNGVTLGGNAAFVLAGVPAPPATIDPGKELRFSVRYTPKVLDTVRGAVSIALFERTVQANLSGSGQGPLFTYEAIPDTAPVAISVNQLLLLPDATVGEKSNLVIRFRNSGNAEGRIPVISVAGAGFTLSDAPFVPLTLAAGAIGQLTVTFTPTQPGRVQGRLRIGNDSFDLAASGLGSNLVYSYAAGAGSFTVTGGGAAVFSPVAVGQSGTLRFSIRNDGTAPTSVHSISVVTTGTVFGLTGLPALPVSIPAGGTATFGVTFTPSVAGSISGSLRIDNLTFTLSASANPPAALPNYTFTGSAGAQQPLQQPAVGLTLASRYDLALSGVLTLTFNSEVFANDPAVQFATGGRTVNFTIPAGQTQAVFPNNATSIRIQTGTVAGTVTLTPSFVSTEAGIVLTPTTPPAQNLTIPQAGPVLTNVALAAKTATGFTLLVTGYATSRSVTQMDFTFTPTSGETVTTTKLSVNVDPSFTAWYQSAASQAFGSLFSATIPFTLQGDVKNVTNVSDTIQSVSVTLTNRLGTSTARSVDLR